MTHLKIFLLLIVCALSVLDGKAQTGIALTDELNGKRIGVIGDSYVRNHKEPFENTWHYKFAKKHGMEYFNYGKNGNSIAYSSPRWGKAMYLRYAEMADSLDYVIVIGGHNDAFKLDSIFDCARKGSIYADNDTFRRIYFQKSKNNTDTAHLNSKGHDRFLKVAESFLLQY